MRRSVILSAAPTLSCAGLAVVLLYILPLAALAACIELGWHA